ncbi:MAG: hypothetical protein H7258_11075 [Ferruginibacter sp.]|nr:hypothetical protein [Ferruginibacter sp.]
MEIHECWYILHENVHLFSAKTILELEILKQVFQVIFKCIRLIIIQLAGKNKTIRLQVKKMIQGNFVVST